MLQKTKQGPEEIITVRVAGLIILTGVKPDQPRKRDIIKRHTTRIDGTEVKRGVNDGYG